MWADDYQQQLWVVNDFDKTASVIDLSTLAVIATVPMPTDLVDMGGIPHDVILEPKGRLAYVSMNGFSGEQHYVVQFRTDTFAEENRAAVGKDPHLSLTGKDSYLYVPCQNSHVVTVLHRKTMEFVTSISVSGAHGAGMPRDGQAFYTTDFLSTGPGGLTAINTATYDVIGSVDTPVGTPHNIALTLDGQKLYITHTGSTSTSVSVFSTSSGSVPVYLKTIQVGLNPFGIAFAR
jgi:YVTN family beta-propeller protein